MKQFFKKNLPIFIFFGVVIILFITNYKSGTILSGWDNLHPEFDFGLNIKRSIFAVWQEYQGLGLLGGMAHSSDLLRQNFLLILSIFLPITLLRYTWTFLTLFIGTSGAFYLIQYILLDENHHSRQNPEQKKLITFPISSMAPFLCACFYLLNLATMQMFYVPFESFVSFFGFLPWVLLASLRYYKSPSRKNIIFLVLTLLLATPAWYIQTLFIVLMIALSIILAPLLLKDKSRNSLLKALKLYGIIFLINSFWLLPAAYFTITNSQVNLNSKINQMATETIFLQNKEFGTLPDVMLLKGFLLKGIDPNSQGTLSYMLKPWNDHLQNPFIEIIGLLLFAIVFVGFIKAVKSKNEILQGLSWLFILSFIALAVDTPPFSFINTLFRDHLPLVNQIFRFPFTKFSTLASLSFAVLFAIGAMELRKRIPKSPYLLIIFLLLFTLPAFNGHLFYNKERAVIPQEYKELFSFFKNQDPNTRIANFPQENFWGWSFYNWPTGGYGGSGFLWYGIRQPILDRAFDVWSQTDENYYFEISQALYSKNQTLLEKVLNKYQINWILVDKNIFDVSSNKALFVPELEGMLSNNAFAKKAATFGNLEVYNINLFDNPKNYVFMTKNLPIVNKYKWDNYDQAYIDVGNYITANRQQPTGNSSFYPFRSLFSEKTQKEEEFNIREYPTYLNLTNQLPPHPEMVLTLPSFTQKEKLIPVQISTQKTNTAVPKLVAKVLLPHVFLGKNELTNDNNPLFQVQLPTIKNEQYPLEININGATFSPILNEDKDIGVAFFVLNSTNVLTVSDKTRQGVTQIVFPQQTFSQLQRYLQLVALPASTSSQNLIVRLPKIDANYLSFHPALESASAVHNCDYFRTKSYSSKLTDNKSLTLSATDATACTAFFAQNLPHDQSYTIFIKGRHIAGQALRFWVENTNEQYAPIDTYLPKAMTQTTSAFILYPMEPFGSSYALHFDNTSIGRDTSINEIDDIAVYPIPYNYLESLQLRTQNTARAMPVDFSNLTVSHPNESLYTVQFANSKTQNATLVLSQSFDPGWSAYSVGADNWFTSTFPFIFGKEIKDHVMVNNWENGWNLDNTQNPNAKTQIVIIYLPQYLEFLGFGLLIAALAILFFNIKMPKRNKLRNKHIE